MTDITFKMPAEMAKEFWAWWMDGGGEGGMWECVDFALDNEISSIWDSSTYTMEYTVSPTQLELDV